MTDTQTDRTPTGTAGLDKVLGGGLTPDRLYLVEGPPGSGKTTLALKFLLDGVAAGEAGLYISLSETEDEMKAVARSHDWSLEGMTLFELVGAEAFGSDKEQSRQHGILGELRSDVDISYLADSVMPLRFFEAQGQVRKSIAVIKTRTSDHERTIREFRIDSSGLAIGAPMRDFTGILSGNPRHVGDIDALIPPERVMDEPNARN